jgi:hypothetical protein
MGALACERVGDALWLAADLQEPCFVGAHLAVVFLVSLPQILLYTVGLPLAATIHLYRRRERLGDKQVQFRWGLLYAGFRHKVWWWELSVVVRKVSMILVGGVFGFHLKPDMQVHLALFLIALMIVAHLVARPFDELTKAHRVLQWLELGSLCVCWLTLHAGTVFFIGEKEGRISHESLTALSFYVVGGNLLFSLYLAAVYVRASCREVKKDNPKLFSRHESSALAIAAASYFRGIFRKDSFAPQPSQGPQAENNANQNPVCLEREVQMTTLDEATTMMDEQNGCKEREGEATATNLAIDAHTGNADDPLPEHWEAFKDESSGQFYYYNHETRESQWQPPA